MPSPLKVDCCIVGAGPAGAVLAYLLARKGVKVTLLEAEKDFDRNFRGDTLHPSIMEIMDDLGLAEKLLKKPHTKVREMGANEFTLINFKEIKTKFPYITMMHQKDFLEFITKESKKFSNFNLIMNANAQQVIKKKGKIAGVRYMKGKQWKEVRARLIVGADGRFSHMRKLGEFEMEKSSPPMDILWFRIPKDAKKDKKLHTGGNIKKGKIILMLEREEYWQMGYIMGKGEYLNVRKRGLKAFQKVVTDFVPRFKGRAKQALKSWDKLSLLVVESSYVKQWYRDGLLLIGDAAHVMTPVGGVGINYAIQDAVVAANVLTQPLLGKRLKLSHLKKVQNKRKWPTKFIQTFQRIIQKKVVGKALKRELKSIPLPLKIVRKIPFIKSIPARLVGIGFWRIRVK
jgi:2-polyprenyl-6-methoxyphenol hydroxylase-like FAD-dependent oxidoreductase